MGSSSTPTPLPTLTLTAVRPRGPSRFPTITTKPCDCRKRTCKKAAKEKELKSLQDLNVYKLVPKSDVPEGQKVIGSKWVCKLYRGPPTTNLNPESWPRDGTKFTAGTATGRTPPYAGFRASGWCLKLIPRRIGRLFKWTSTLPSCTLRSKRRKRC